MEYGTKSLREPSKEVHKISKKILELIADLIDTMYAKNAVGMAGLLLLLGNVLAPALKIIVLMLGLKLASAVTQPLADGRISNFLTSITKGLSMLLAVIIGAGFMYFVTIGLIIMTGNVI